MKESRIMMGMPVAVEITDIGVNEEPFRKVFSYFQYVDDKFSTYKKASEITRINNGELQKKDYSADMKLVFDLSEKTRRETDGYFDIRNAEGKYDPSGLVKGWAIHNAANILRKDGLKNFYVDAGGDIQVSGNNAAGRKWSVGIRNPFNRNEIVKAVYLSEEGIATSGTYIRGDHIYNPKDRNRPANEIMSLTVIGPDVYEADRFATAAFAMGKQGIIFIEKLGGFDGYMIDKDGIGTETSGFGKYTDPNR